MNRLFTFLTAFLCSAVSVCSAYNHVIRFTTAAPSHQGEAIWKVNDFSATGENPDTLWERQSLPIGNGDFGATVLGGINRERLVLNEKSLWTGGPASDVKRYWNMNRKVDTATLESVRDLLKAGKNALANELVSEAFRGNAAYDRHEFGTYTMLGEVYVDTPTEDGDNATGYIRQLDIDSALVTVTYHDAIDNHSYSRRYFASAPDSVQVWQFSSSNPAQKLTLSFATPQQIDSITPLGSDGLLWHGHLADNGMCWALAVKGMDANACEVDANKGIITTTGPNVTFVVAAATDYYQNMNPDFNDPLTYVGSLPDSKVVARVNAASALGYDSLLERHLADYRNLFCRVELNIPASDESLQLMPTPQRLARYRSGLPDPQLEELYFQFGRYLVIASSRQGSLATNLQGLWHNNLDGPWRVDYHNNINLQMNYWPVLSTNLEECFEPYERYVQSLVKPGRLTAQAYYNAPGWTAAISSNIFGFTAPLNAGEMNWNYNPVAGPWLATQLLHRYEFSGNKQWLINTWPIVKESADFALALLTPYQGYLTVAPSYSPEHGGCDVGTTYANAVVRELLSAALSAAKDLNLPADSTARWKTALAQLPPYRIGRYGQLQEWWEDIDQYGDHHRHTNHLYGLHPGASIDAVTTPEIADACRETLRQRGDEATGWSMGWKLNHWARLLDGEHAHLLLSNLIKNGTADNLFDMHPPFQIDGNFGGTAGIAEMLLQSQNDRIHLLPAFPKQWGGLSVKGLRARGNFEVDIFTNADGLDYALIHSLSGGKCTVVYGNQTRSISTRKGATYKVSLKNSRLKVE